MQTFIHGLALNCHVTMYKLTNIFWCSHALRSSRSCVIVCSALSGALLDDDVQPVSLGHINSPVSGSVQSILSKEFQSIEYQTHSVHSVTVLCSHFTVKSCSICITIVNSSSIMQDPIPTSKPALSHGVLDRAVHTSLPENCKLMLNL